VNAPQEAGRLLVVDDNEMNRDMLSRRLERKGYTVLTAEDGHQALAMLEAQPFDLVLLDIMMPGIDGVEVLKRIRATKGPSELPVIMVTAKDGSEDVVAALKHGASDYVTKPIDFPVVLARTQTQLTLKHAAQALKDKMEEVARLAADLEVRNAFIRKVFGRYLTDEVVHSLLETPEGLRFGGETRRVTILMSDLRGFSAMAERLGPEQVVGFLNHYLGAMAEVITRYQGTIDEFIGDAVLAIFGAPVTREDDAERAVACALEMQLAMAEVNAWCAQRGLPPVEMGIGVHSGLVVVGNIGSDRRAKYGVVGSTVNLAGRIESFTVGGQVLVSDATAAAVGPILQSRRTLPMEAKGIKGTITIHEVAGLAGRHNLILPADEPQWRTPGTAVAVRYSILEGKHGGGEVLDGAFTALSTKHAVLRGARAPMPGQNLKVAWLAADGAPLGDVYAKVMDLHGDGVVLRFTSVPPDVTRALQGALGL